MPTHAAVPIQDQKPIPSQLNSSRMPSPTPSTGNLSNPSAMRILQMQQAYGNRAVLQMMRARMQPEALQPTQTQRSTQQSPIQMVSYTEEEVKRLHALLESKEDLEVFKQHLTVFEEGDVEAGDLLLLASRTMINKDDLLRNIEKGDNGFVREVLLALSYLKKFGVDDTIIQFDTASKEQIVETLQSVGFHETAEMVLQTEDPVFYSSSKTNYKTPIGADIVVWVKTVKDGVKNSFVQSKNITGGASKWKEDIPYYVSYAAGQLAGFNQNEFSIKPNDFFDGVVYITYNPSKDLLDNKSALNDKITAGLKKLHDFDLTKMNKETPGMADEMIKRQIEYTSKVIVDVPLAKQTYEYDLQSQQVSMGTSDLSRYNIKTEETKIEHNEVTEEEQLLASETEKHMDAALSELDELSISLLTQCEKAVVTDTLYGEVFQEHYYYGIGAFGVDKFIQRVLQIARLQFIKDNPTNAKMKQLQKNTFTKSMELLQDKHLTLWGLEDELEETPVTEEKKSKKEKKSVDPRIRQIKVLNEEISDMQNETYGTENAKDFYHEYKGMENFDGKAFALDWPSILRRVGVNIIGLE